MGYRNAFAHGSFSTDGRIVKLTYFEGKPIEKILDQNFFDAIEKSIEECYRKITAITKTLEIIRK